MLTDFPYPLIAVIFLYTFQVGSSLIPSIKLRFFSHVVVGIVALNAQVLSCCSFTFILVGQNPSLPRRLGAFLGANGALYGWYKAIYKAFQLNKLQQIKLICDIALNMGHKGLAGIRLSLCRIFDIFA
ncbi:hypothetical protein XELAEV_18014171mg [Xenopus laevis]|uniref:Uncharacterized protein n=1 Tax=Xenopus laevis TaxID=8355 RepID=A0A974DHW6_XENLA|nr:hypothetical protein XELAEV_18014171mg [Xenopus laevis]